MYVLKTVARYPGNSWGQFNASTQMLPLRRLRLCVTASGKPAARTARRVKSRSTHFLNANDLHLPENWLIITSMPSAVRKNLKHAVTHIRRHRLSVARNMWRPATRPSSGQAGATHWTVSIQEQR
ncbi:hypothetical protein GCM10011400_65860 [Paraburkholderia caffeinilytica]|uniref:Transposase n=1 Tax=Paraburkholderia caffeinilytica TaxID=1761016 RepID=A0ABQ1NBT2_9BURK|nr:hypothetical protein GCM10011400_65860 [Paraburkholderia caffeinilytica]